MDNPIVSIIISNRNDTAMLAITVRSCLEELKAVQRGGEIVIVDNSDEEIWKALKAGSFISSVYLKEGVVRLYRQDYPCLFTAREEAAKQARGSYIICLDGHMIVGRDMIKDLVDFMNRHKEERIGFAHAPISWAHQHASRAKHDRDVSKNELGPWGTVYDGERKITWKGMPWICRRQWFISTLRGYGALSKYKLSWGGGDMHIGVKPWLLGYENWAVPTSPAIHIGPFPKVGGNNHTYRLYSESGRYPASFGFLVSCYVLGGEEMMKRNAPVLVEKFKLDIDKYWKDAIELGEDERAWLSRHQIMSFDEWLSKRPWNAN